MRRNERNFITLLAEVLELPARLIAEGMPQDHALALGDLRRSLLLMPVQVPLAPMLSRQDRRAFIEQQRRWLEQEQQPGYDDAMEADIRRRFEMLTRQIEAPTETEVPEVLPEEEPIARQELDKLVDTEDQRRAEKIRQAQERNKVKILPHQTASHAPGTDLFEDYGRFR